MASVMGRHVKMKVFNMSAKDMLGVGRACPSMPSTPQTFEQDGHLR